MVILDISLNINEVLRVTCLTSLLNISACFQNDRWDYARDLYLAKPISSTRLSRLFTVKTHHMLAKSHKKPENASQEMMKVNRTSIHWFGLKKETLVNLERHQQNKMIDPNCTHSLKCSKLKKKEDMNTTWYKWEYQWILSNI